MDFLPHPEDPRAPLRALELVSSRSECYVRHLDHEFPQDTPSRLGSTSQQPARHDVEALGMVSNARIGKMS